MGRSAKWLLLSVIGCLSLVELTSAATPPETKSSAIIAISRRQGNARPNEPITHYDFSVAEDGAWSFRPFKGEVKRGKLTAEEVNRWKTAIKQGGFASVRSNPQLGLADEPYMEISLLVERTRQRKRIPLNAKLSQAIEAMVVELVQPGQ